MGKHFAFLAVLPLAGLLLAAGHDEARPPDTPGWTEFRLDPQNDARVRGTLTVTWTIRAGGSYSSSPTFDRGRLFIGNNNGDVYAIDPNDGKITWSAHFASSVMGAPIVYHGKVFVFEGAQEQYSPVYPHPTSGPVSENGVIALDERNGEPQWRFPLRGTGMPTGLILDGTLVHHNGAGQLVGLDAATGALRFQRLDRGIASMTAALPIGGGRFVTTAVWPNTIRAYSVTNGSTLWEHDFPATASGVGDCPPATDGKRVFCDYLAPPAGAPNRSVLIGEIAGEHAYAVAAANGNLVWDVVYEHGPLPAWNEAAIPLVAYDRVYVGSSVSASVHALDPATGATLWVVPVHGPVKGGIVSQNRTVYFGDLAGYLWAVDASDGHVIGSKNMHSSFNVGSPVIVGHTLIIGSRTGELFALPVETIRNTHDR